MSKTQYVNKHIKLSIWIALVCGYALGMYFAWQHREQPGVSEAETFEQLAGALEMEIFERRARPEQRIDMHKQRDAPKLGDEILVFALRVMEPGIPLLPSQDIYVTTDLAQAEAHIEANAKRHAVSMLKVLRMPNGDLEWLYEAPVQWGNTMQLKEITGQDLLTVMWEDKEKRYERAATSAINEER